MAKKDAAERLKAVSVTDLTPVVLALLDNTFALRQQWLINVADFYDTAVMGFDDDLELIVAGGVINVSWGHRSLGFEYEAFDYNDAVYSLSGGRLSLHGIQIPHSLLATSVGKTLGSMIELKPDYAGLSGYRIKSAREGRFGAFFDLDIPLIPDWSTIL